MNWPKEIVSILSVGRSLKDDGINNWGLTRNQALKAIDQLFNLKIPVLGGDLLKVINGRSNHTYDNWSCDQNDGESDADYLVRSKTEAMQFINIYVPESREDLLIELVPRLR